MLLNYHPTDCGQNFINFMTGDGDLNIFSLIHEREFIVFSVHMYSVRIKLHRSSGFRSNRHLLRHCCFVWSKITGPHSSGNFNDTYECIYSHVHTYECMLFKLCLVNIFKNSQHIDLMPWPFHSHQYFLCF